MKGPIVFLTLAEQQRGEIDGFVTITGSYQYQHGSQR
jgi:hypothetical protein